VAGVTPRQIYQALINAGASTTQAIGIMANMISESTLNPEAVGDQGTSFGLVQQHGGQYASLVTGNPAADMTAQVKVLAQNGGFFAASGATPADAAGNFSARYERCTTCQPHQTGPVSWTARVANAAVVAGWVKSGNWPTSAGSAAQQAAGSGPAASGASDPTCAFGFTYPNLNPINVVKGLIGLGGGGTAICVLHKTTIRHAAGVLAMLSGGSVVLVGAVILAASAFQRTGAQRAVTQAVGVLPGGQAIKQVARRAPARAAPRARSRAAESRQPAT
jgi:hypothetical protein